MIPTVTLVTVTGTYNTPPGCKYIKVFIIGGGGGGGGGEAAAQGAGGGSGKVLQAFLDAGSYSFVRGAAGAGGAAGLDGTAGGTSTFNGLAAAGGGFGTDGPLSSFGGITTSTEIGGTLFMGSHPGESGTAVGVRSGNGGTNMFSSGGKGNYRVTLDGPGDDGIGFGAGGGGGTGVTGVGGSGTVGAAVVIEYY